MTHRCDGCAGLPIMSRTWHGLYRKWHRADLAGRTKRAAVYGWCADRIVNHA